MVYLDSFFQHFLVVSSLRLSFAEKKVKYEVSLVGVNCLLDTESTVYFASLSTGNQMLRRVNKIRV